MAERMYYQRETLGSLIQNRAFILYIVCFSISLVIFVILHGIQFWFHIMVFSPWAVCGIVTASYLATIIPLTSVISWILIDQNSWLVNTILLFITGGLFVVCGIHLFLQMNKPETVEDLKSYDSITNFFTDAKSNFSLSSWKHYFQIVNVFVSINFFKEYFTLFSVTIAV